MLYVDTREWSNQEGFYVNIPLFNRESDTKDVTHIVADFTNLLLVEHIPHKMNGLRIRYKE